MQILYRTGAFLALVFLLAASATAQQRFYANLSGDNQVPTAVDTEASGVVRVVLDGTTITVTGGFQGLESDYNTAIGSHIHRGAADENGPVEVALMPELSADMRSGVYRAESNTFSISEGLADSIRTGLAYVNVHSVDNPGGEIRGQLLPGPTSGRALVQVIHNSPDPAAAVVDIYVNGNLALNDVAFRQATPFVDAPANRDLTLAVAPGTSTSAADAIYTKTVRLSEGMQVQVVAQGVLDPSMFSPNPSGQSTAFELLVVPEARVMSPFADKVALRAIHGSARCSDGGPPDRRQDPRR